MPDDGHVLRVFRFRPVVPEFDGFMRTEMLPAVARLPGLLDGPRGPARPGIRAGTASWRRSGTSRAAMIDGRRRDPRAVAVLSRNGWRKRSIGRSTPSISGSSCRSRPPSHRRCCECSGGRSARASSRTTSPRCGPGRWPTPTQVADPPRSISPRTHRTASSRSRSGRRGRRSRSPPEATSTRPTITKDSRRLVGIDVAHYETVREAT